MDDLQISVQGAIWKPGTTVGRYLLLAQFAEGGMAQIWLARQTGLKGFEKLVVVKRMMGSLEADPEHVEMFLSEARVAAQLDHPHVVQIFELGEDQGSYYIAMEYLDGENLSHVRKASVQTRRHLPDVLAARIVAWAAEGLHYAHTRKGMDGTHLGVVHRDVSPQNLILTYQGGLKVVDFGIAKLESQHTNSGKLKGKIAYMSPEQARAEPVDARSDVFALGVVLFEQLTRTRLAGKLNELETLKLMSSTEPLPRVSERRPDVPRELDQIVARALERDKDRRYPSAKDLQIALENWVRATGESASSSDVADFMQQLFGDRIHERHRLIETALKLEFTPNAARTLQDIATGIGAGSGSSRISRSELRELQGSRRLPLVIGVSAAVLGLGLGAWAVASRGEARPAVVEPVQAPRPPEPAVLAVDSQPSGATIEIDGQPRGPAPVTWADATLGEHTVAASLDGHQTATRTLKVERAGQRLDVTLALVPLPAAAPDAGATADRPAANKPAAKRAQGRLTLKTEPWTTVYLGSSKLGDTPLVAVPLPAGRHVLRLTNPESGIQSSIEVEVPAGGTVVKKLKL